MPRKRRIVKKKTARSALSPEKTASRKHKTLKRKAASRKHRGTKKTEKKKARSKKTSRKKQLSVRKEFTAIGRELAHATMVYDLDEDQAWINKQLQSRDSEAIRILQRQFHRVIVLDSRKGVDTLGRFRSKSFLRYALVEMCAALELNIDTGEFHPGQISQILKDELAEDQQSLFCFLNAHCLSEKGIECVRGFMLSGHKVLICGRNPLLDEDSFPTSWVGYSGQSALKS